MQSITVKFIEQTNTRPIRYSASCAAGSIIVSQSNADENQYHRAAKALIEKLKWVDNGVWVEGSLKNGDTVFVCHAKGRPCEVLDLSTVEEMPFHKIKHDVNGNPRYVVDYSYFLSAKQTDRTFIAALKNAKKCYGLAYRGRDFRAGIVFSTYGIDEVATLASEVTGRSFKATQT